MAASHSFGPVLSFPGAEHLTETLEQIAHAKRPEAVLATKELLKSERLRIKNLYHERINEFTGMDIAVRLSAVVDAIIKCLAERAFRKAGAPERWDSDVGVLALGGYGRGEFNPYSDLDVMVVAAGRSMPAWLSDANAEFQTLMWDGGFQVGASMRSLVELEHIIASDFVTATALCEQRPLIAAPSLAENVMEILHRFRKRRIKPFLKYKVQEVRERQEKTGASIYRMEPNLKTNPGGLRDIQFLRSVAPVCFGNRNLHALRELDQFDWNDVNNLLAANDHLLGLRSLLHFHHGRKHDQFMLADQVRCAEELGYGGGKNLKGVEQLMKIHYQKVMQIDRAVEITIHKLGTAGYLGRQRPLIATRRSVGKDFVAIDRRLYVANRELWNGPDPIYAVMKAIRAGQEKGYRLSLELQRDITEHLHFIDEACRSHPGIIKEFRTILQDVGRLSTVLKDMHRCGLLGVLLPEFGNITCHMQFDAYHEYTVDEHTLLGIRYLDAIANEEAYVPRAVRRVFQRLRSEHDLLALSLILHDVGKFLGRGHVPRGALMVSAVAKRWGLQSAEEELVHHLVLRHTELSSASRSRDFSDVEFLEQFANKMVSPHYLDHLLCLTWADARSVGEGIMTGWQESLLIDCYWLIREFLEGKPLAFSTHSGRIEKRLQDAGAAATATDIRHFIDSFSSSYVFQASPADVDLHWQSLRDMRAGADMSLHYRCEPTWFTISVAYRDRANLLAQVASILTGSGLDIQGARVWTSTDGFALLSLRVESPNAIKWTEDGTEAWEGLRKRLSGIVGDGVSETQWIRRREQSISPDAIPDSGYDETEVKIVEVNRTSTVLDVKVHDRVGLLAQVCNIIANHECRIDFASVNTMGDVAVDVFYISRDDFKLEPTEAEEIRSEVEARVGG